MLSVVFDSEELDVENIFPFKYFTIFAIYYNGKLTVFRYNITFDDRRQRKEKCVGTA